MAKFSDVFSDETRCGRKIPTNEYLPLGKYPIIDQGQTQIAGYSNSEDGLFRNIPAIIFGDHTRNIKYIDTPFFLGADGVKLLKCKVDNADYKYLYYCLQSIKIPDTGYNRHFKWLKEAAIPLPPLDEQRKIAAVLDKVSDLIAKRRQQLDKLDEMVKARFVEMFGDCYTNPYNLPIAKWNDVFNTTTGKLDSNAAVDNGKYPFFTCSKEILRIDKYAFDQEALLLAGNNAAGKYDVKHYYGKFNAYQRTYVLSLKQDWSYALFQFQLEDKLGYLQQQSLGGLTKYLTLKILKELEFIIPAKEEQDKFAAFVEQTEKSKTTISRSLEKLETLKKALMQEYFG